MLRLSKHFIYFLGSLKSIQNLMNQNIQNVAAVLLGAGDGLQKYKLASVHDLISLKHLNPNTKVKYADITPRVRQNYDACDQ